MSTIPVRLGYTHTEEQILTALIADLQTAVTVADWHEKLPVEFSRDLVLEGLGNSVKLSLKLYNEYNTRKLISETNLYFGVLVHSSGKERWLSADGGFFVSHGLPDKVLADILTLKQNMPSLQEKLAEQYKATFYNS